MSCGKNRVKSRFLPVSQNVDDLFLIAHLKDGDFGCGGTNQPERHGPVDEDTCTNQREAAGNK
jgi:hypothetical protein